MTVGDQRRFDSVGLAKALHPAGWNRLSEPQPDCPSADPRPPSTSTDQVQTALWQEDACRAWLRVAKQGWLSGRQGRLPVIIAAVDDDEVLLVARPAWDLGDTASEVSARLEVGGVTPEQRRWAVRVDGPLETVALEVPTLTTGAVEGAARPGVGTLDPEEFAVLALTIRSIRGFESAGRPDRP